MKGIHPWGRWIEMMRARWPPSVAVRPTSLLAIKSSCDCLYLRWVIAPNYWRSSSWFSWVWWELHPKWRSGGWSRSKAKELIYLRSCFLARRYSFSVSIRGHKAAAVNWRRIIYRAMDSFWPLAFYGFGARGIALSLEVLYPWRNLFVGKRLIRSPVQLMQGHWSPSQLLIRPR